MKVEHEQQVRDMVRAHGSGWLVTAGDGQPAATLVPLLWREGSVVAHLARANPHWRAIADGAPGLMVVGGPEAYVSPSWYASKAEHGRVVPTWNYTAVQFAGPVHLRHEVEWLRTLVTELTDHHESGRVAPWRVSDAPAEYLESMLRAIVGVELVIEQVHAKAKLSQNRSLADQEGVIAGLGGEPGPGPAAIAAEMAARRPSGP